jgi:pimeloyl-ACP methyl ester carboxylesterase
MVEAEELQDIVLVGHSYGGMIISAVADCLGQRIKHLVYLDAAVPDDGADFAAHVPGMLASDIERRRTAFRAMSPDGLWLPAIAAEMVGVTNENDVAWLQRRLTPHPLRTWLDPVHLVNGLKGIPKTYVLATQPLTTAMGYPAQAEIRRPMADWNVQEIACGHDMMLIKPEQTAALLLDRGGV